MTTENIQSVDPSVTIPGDEIDDGVAVPHTQVIANEDVASDGNPFPVKGVVKWDTDQVATRNGYLSDILTALQALAP